MTADNPLTERDTIAAAKAARTYRPLRLVAGERDLVGRIRARDERALRHVIEAASPWLLGVARSIVREPDEAEEVVLGVFQTLWDRADTITDADGALMPWLLHVTRNRCLDLLRSRRRHVRRVELATQAALAEPGAAPAHEVNEAAVPGWHVHARVHAALETLTPEQRQLVQLAYFEGLSQSECAEMLGIPLGTVKTRLRSAYGKLRVLLASLKDWTP